MLERTYSLVRYCVHVHNDEQVGTFMHTCYTLHQVIQTTSVLISDPRPRYTTMHTRTVAVAGVVRKDGVANTVLALQLR